MSTKQFGHVGVQESSTTPAGNIALLFGFDYDRGGGKPVQAALLSWQEARKMAQHIITLTEAHAVAEIAKIQASPSPLSTVVKRTRINPNVPDKKPPGKELVKKDEAPQKRTRIRRRP